MDKNIYSSIIFMLMLTTGLILYFMYIKKIEGFETTLPNITLPTPTLPPPRLPPPTFPNTIDMPIITCPQPNLALNNKSILSRYFGVGFNIEFVKKINTTNLYLIKHIPTISTGTLGGCYALSNDNLLTIRLKNSIDDTQLWTFTEKTDNTSKYYVVQPKNNLDFALQYENGNLALRPYNSSSIFEGQKWIIKDFEITRGIPVLNYSPGSLFTPEFDPYSIPDSNNSNITDQNTQQINDVINSVKTGIQQYLGQLDKKNQMEQVSSSALGEKGMPLNINLNLSTKSNQISEFENVYNSTSDMSNDMIDIMDRYGPGSSNKFSNYTELYRKKDLENEINNNQGCKLLNINDYTSNRVGSCNCKL